MELWTEYEGRTIDGAFPLKKLLLPEGRSAFFSTSNGKGVPTVIRLIASHFDEEEILARWRGVEALGHPNILKIEQYGQLVLDDTTVVYAVIEPVDANLAEVIGGQRLTVPEARQLGASLASALEVLHMHGFVHEHVEPANVFAVGEVVKLRGDCIRETPEGESGVEAKRRDIHDLAVVLLQALTQADSLETATRIRPLPAPFDEVVRHGLSGTWGLAEMQAALEVSEASKVAAEAAASRAASVAAERLEPGMEPGTGQGTAAGKRAAEPEFSREVAEARPVTGKFVPPSARPLFLVENEGRRGAPPVKWLAAGAVALLLVFWLIWHVTHGKPASQVAAQGSVASGAAPVAPSAAKSRAAKPTATPATARRPQATIAGAGPHEQWRVVAFTYNRAEQAQKKVDSIGEKHADLRPEVFSPTGRAPYLVTVGGAMEREQAVAFVQRARRLGMPRDTYAQNYGGKRR